jgi:hypothetical protein
MQYAGVNYLVPIDAQLRDEVDLRRMARVDEILSDLQQARNLRILVLDSCRDNPLADELWLADRPASQSIGCRTNSPLRVPTSNRSLMSNVSHPMQCFLIDLDMSLPIRPRAPG